MKAPRDGLLAPIPARASPACVPPAPLRRATRARSLQVAPAVAPTSSRTTTAPAASLPSLALVRALPAPSLLLLPAAALLAALLAAAAAALPIRHHLLHHIHCKPKTAE